VSVKEIILNQDHSIVYATRQPIVRCAIADREMILILHIVRSGHINFILHPDASRYSDHRSGNEDNFDCMVSAGCNNGINSITIRSSSHILVSSPVSSTIQTVAFENT
jgi:hypothetical protein